MAEEYKWDEPRRQPAAAIVVVIFKSFVSIFKMFWPGFLAIVFSQKKDGRADKWIIISAVLVAGGLVYAMLEFFFFRYFITGDELVIKKGFFNKREIVLPLSRIQAVHLDQDWLHRLLNIVKVSVDSPGASNAEVKFSLKKDTAEALRSYIVKERSYSSDDVQEPEAVLVPVFALEGSDLVKLGISSNFLKAFFLILAFSISLLDNIGGITGKNSGDWMMWVGDQATQSSSSLIAAAVGTVLLISVFVSFLMVVLKYGGFRIERTGNGFHIKSGLLNRKEKVIPFTKVQYISWDANWIRRYIPYYLLQFHVIGETTGKSKWDISVPVTRYELFEPLLANYHPMLPLSSPVIKVHRAYFFRKTLIAFIVYTIIFIALYFMLDGYAALIYLPFPLSAIGIWRFQRKFNAQVSETAIQVNRDVFGKSSVLLRWEKIQSVNVRQSIFQRRRDIATVRLSTAGGTISLPFISISQANTLRDFAIYKVEIQTSKYV